MTFFRPFFMQKQGAFEAFSSLVLNFHFVEYEEDIDALSQISQEELVQELRRHGRVQQNLKI